MTTASEATTGISKTSVSLIFAPTKTSTSAKPMLTYVNRPSSRPAAGWRTLVAASKSTTVPAGRSGPLGGCGIHPHRQRLGLALERLQGVGERTAFAEQSRCNCIGIHAAGRGRR